MGYLLDFYTFLRSKNLFKMIAIIFLIIISGSVLFAIFEKDITFFNAIWWSLVTLTTVGYGDITPNSVGGKFTGIIIMFFGIGMLGIFTATIASSLIEKKAKENKGLLTVNVKDHIIICGWNYRTPEIIKELRANTHDGKFAIVLIADIEYKVLDDDKMYFIHGDVTEENLKKANIKDAKTVIILLDERLDEYTRDAKAILNTLTVETLNPDVYTCVELISSDNVNHCKRAKADEIVVIDEFSVKLLSQAAINHGITDVITEILSKKYGNDLYKFSADDLLEGKTFLDTIVLLKKRYNCLPVAVQSVAQNKTLTNPSSDYVIKRGDKLIIIAEEKPKF